MILWLKNAPKFDPERLESIDPVTEFIDSIITTTSDDPEIQSFIKYQEHRCCHTCHKTVRGKDSCRFGAPFPPMDKTRILQPFEGKIDKDETKEIREFIKKMNTLLDSKTITTLDEFLLQMNCTMDKYLFILSTQLKSNKIYIKRSPKVV